MATDGRIDSEGCPDGMVLSDGFNDGSPLGSIEVAAYQARLCTQSNHARLVLASVA